MEYMDLVDDNDNIIKAVTREYFDKNNSRNYRVVNIIIINSNNQIVLAQRSKKRNGLVDVIFFCRRTCYY